MKLECKCHGVSGSCSLRTCWLAMSDFRRTGDYLRKKYNTAIEATMNQDGTGFMVADKDFKGSTKNELVYVENSPDYCLTERSAGEWRRVFFNRLNIIFFEYLRCKYIKRGKSTLWDKGGCNVALLWAQCSDSLLKMSHLTQSTQRFPNNPFWYFAMLEFWEVACSESQ